MKTPTFEDTPQYKTACAEAELEHTKDRKAKAAEKLTVETDRTTALAPLQKAVASATAKVVKAQQNLVSAHAELGQVNIGLHNLNARADAHLNRLDAALREDAIPGIKAFLDSIYAVWEHERRRWQWLAPVDAKGEPMPARARMDQIASIRKRAEALYF